MARSCWCLQSTCAIWCIWPTRRCRSTGLARSAFLTSSGANFWQMHRQQSHPVQPSKVDSFSQERLDTQRRGSQSRAQTRGQPLLRVQRMQRPSAQELGLPRQSSMCSGWRPCMSARPPSSPGWSSWSAGLMRPVLLPLPMAPAGGPRHFTHM